MGGRNRQKVPPALSLGIPFKEGSSPPEAPTRPPAPVTLRLPRERPRYGSAGIALLLHLLILALFLGTLDRDLAQRLVPLGAGAKPGGGGGGGGRFVGYISLPALHPPAAAARSSSVPVAAPVVVQQPAPVVAAPNVRPDPEPVEPPRDSIAVSATAAPDASGGATQGGAGAGGGTGGGVGVGAGTGAGAGAGPGAGGQAARGTDPAPIFQPIPMLEDRPRELAGVALQITFWVRSDGSVDNIDVQPPIRDRGYDKKLREILRLWRFSPARTAEGQAVPGVKTFTYTP